LLGKDPVIIPVSVDWSSENRVTPVKYQGTCGSCWAFSTIAAMESKFAIDYAAGHLTPPPPVQVTDGFLNFSEQQLVDCDVKKFFCPVQDLDSWNYGCKGGWECGAHEYFTRNYVMGEGVYPYVG
jgi:hypothetical protein